jgi:hypothetical protein
MGKGIEREKMEQLNNNAEKGRIYLYMYQPALYCV